jgi:hypothetical protein
MMENNKATPLTMSSVLRNNPLPGFSEARSLDSKAGK